MDNILVKGDTHVWEITVKDETNAVVDITNWKIRATIWDNNSHVVKMASANSGGSDSQAKVTDGPNGEFLIACAKGLTTDFADNSFLEVETENADGQILTVLQEKIKFMAEKITWSTL